MSARKEPESVLSDNSKGVGNSGIRIVPQGDDAVVWVYGRLDIDSSPPLRDQLLALFTAKPRRELRIDLSAVTDIDSAGVATLIEALKTARAHDSELRLQGLQDRVLSLFEVTGILSLFNGSTRA
ncbi:MAG: STAS domain-containing protein [Acidobacteria bacterium]|nr:STAS domain-containing protein [Acidobacteriota bacterium]